MTKLVEVVTGLPWKPENHIYGAVCTQSFADHHREEQDRLDRKLLRESTKWREIEKDDTRGGALPEHMQIVENLPMGRRDEKA